MDQRVRPEPDADVHGHPADQLEPPPLPGSGTVQVEAYTIQGAGHSVPSDGMAAVALEFSASPDELVPQAK